MESAAVVDMPLMTEPGLGVNNLLRLHNARIAVDKSL